MRTAVIEKALGRKIDPKFLVQDGDGRMLLPLMTFMPYCMDRKQGTERTWHFRSREYGELGCPFQSNDNPRYFNTVIEITPEIAREIATPRDALRTYDDGKVGAIYLHSGRFDPSEDRREWYDYLRRLRVLIQLIERPK